MKTINITDKYIDLSKANITKGSRVLIDAPTGSGKSTSALSYPICNKSEDMHSTVILLVPTIAIGKAKETKDIPFYYDDKVPYGDKWISTYDNILKVQPHILETAIVFFDEIHLLAISSYRKRLPTVFEYVYQNAKTVVGMSGTVNYEVFSGHFNDVVKFLPRKSREIKVYNMPILPVETTEGKLQSVSSYWFSLNVVSKLLEQGKNVILLHQNKIELELLRQHFEEKGIRAIKYVSKDGVVVDNNEEAHKMVSTGIIDDNVRLIIGTSVIVEGWDLKSHKSFEVVIAGGSHIHNNIKAPTAVIQLAQRLRNNTTVNVYIQRNLHGFDNTYTGLSAYTETELKAKRKLALAKHKKQGYVDKRYLTKGLEFTTVPSFEQKQAQINYINDYSPHDDTKYNEQLKLLGGENCMGTTTNPIPFDENLIITHDISEILLAIFTDSSLEYYSLNEYVIRDFVNGDDVEVPESFVEFREWCFINKTNATKRLTDITRIMNAFAPAYIVEKIQEKIKNGDTIDIDGFISPYIYKLNLTIEGRVNRYEVRDRLLEQIGNSKFTKAQMKSLIKKIPMSCFYSKSDKDHWLRTHNGKHEINVVKMYEPFIDIEGKQTKTKGKKSYLYKVVDDSLLNEEYLGNKRLDVIDSELAVLKVKYKESYSSNTKQAIKKKNITKKYHLANLPSYKQLILEFEDIS